MVSPLIHCGAVFGHLQGLRIFTALLLRSNHFPHIAVHIESFKLFCSHPSFPQDKSWQVSTKLSAEILNVMAPVVAAHRVVMVTFSTPLKLPYFVQATSLHLSIGDITIQTINNSHNNQYLTFYLLHIEPQL